MRTLKLLVVALLATISLNAQEAVKLNVWKGGTKTEFALSSVDSLTFSTYIASEDVLTGVFSVSATKQVRFSKGNLQYTQSTQTWSFAAHQYDIIGTDNIEGGTEQKDTVVGFYYKEGANLSDKIDLFGWSGSTSSTKWGVGTSKDNTDYAGDLVDWGKNIGDGKTWYTLTSDEWSYLFGTRADADKLVGLARINLNADGTEYANGIILLPDAWTCPAGVTFKSGGFSETNNGKAYADNQTFTLSDWQKLESAGAIFLPASGYRRRQKKTELSNVSYVQSSGYYWSATPDAEDSESAYCLTFDSTAELAWSLDRFVGRAVRLVQDVK